MALHLESRSTSLWTFLGSLCLLVLIAFFGGQYDSLYPFPISSARFNSFIQENQVVVCAASAGMAAFVYIIVWFNLTSQPFIRLIHLAIEKNKGVEDRRHCFLLEQRKNFDYFHFFVLLAIEEVVARWLFLGILPQHIPGSFYFFLILGSAFWLWFRDRYFFNMPSKLYTLWAQFIVSFFYAFIFCKYGIIASYLTHLGTQSLLMTLHKVEDSNPAGKDFRFFGLSSFYVIAASVFLFIDFKAPWSMSNWITQSNFKIEGWDFYDYLASSVVAFYTVKSLGLFLHFDQGCVRPSGMSYTCPKPYQVALGWALLACITFTGCILMYFLSIQLKALILTLFICLFYKASSGSGRVRNFWSMLVIVFVTLCIVNTLPLYWILAYLGAHTLLYLPFMVMERKSCLI